MPTKHECHDQKFILFVAVSIIIRVPIALAISVINGIMFLRVCACVCVCMDINTYNELLLENANVNDTNCRSNPTNMFPLY
jgi:hypothetical protein